MTPRLKKLLIGFAISLVIMVSDRISRNSSSSSTSIDSKGKKEEKRPRTARIGASRMRRVKEEAARIRKSKEKKPIIPKKKFKPIPEDVLALADWGRNPFSSQDPLLVNQVIRPVKSTNKPEKMFISKVSNVHALKIESVATLGDKTFVIINGHRYQEGDNIDNMIIETIESKRIIFKSGTKTIVKNVGS